MRRAGVVLVALIFSSSASHEELGVVSGGSLTAEQERQVLEAVVRESTRLGSAPCKNYGSKAAYCLSVGGQEPETALLKRLVDVRPPVLSLGQCLRDGVVGPWPEGVGMAAFKPSSTDPVLDVAYLKVVSRGGVEARTTLYCDASGLLLAWRQSRWVVTAGAQMAKCLLPADCEDLQWMRGSRTRR